MDNFKDFVNNECLNLRENLKEMETQIPATLESLLGQWLPRPRLSLTAIFH